MNFLKKIDMRTWLTILTGVVIGGASVLLVATGNPGNMGFCIACFVRDWTGALGLHQAATVQYIRPEIAGLILGATVVTIATKEFKPRGGSSPLTRFVLGFCVMVGALMFLGCPTRMLIRIGGGDLNAIVGLFGFAAGIIAGIPFFNKGFSLKKSQPLSKAEGLVFPIMIAVIFIISLFGVFDQSTSGPGAMAAPIVIALVAGLVVGGLMQRSRFCTVGGIRDSIMFKDFHLFWGLLALVVATIVGNLITGNFKLGFEGQPIAMTDGLWNFLGLFLVGLASVLLGGCPMRQLVLAGSGNTDSGITVIGMIAGAAMAHNFNWASSPAGPTAMGQVAVAVCIVVVLAIALLNIQRKKA